MSNPYEYAPPRPAYIKTVPLRHQQVQEIAAYALHWARVGRAVHGSVTDVEDDCLARDPAWNELRRLVREAEGEET